MASNAVVAGPTSKRVAANIERVRKARHLKQKDVSDALGAIGRATLTTVVSKIERGERRIDVDDVVAIALALNVSPLTLLMPDEADDQPVKLTDGWEVSSRTAWAWALGREPAMDPTPDGYPIGPGDDSVTAGETDVQRQEYDRLRSEYLALALPQGLQRAAERPAVRLARQIEELVADIASDTADDAAGRAALLRMAKRRYQQLGIELDEIEDQLEG
ncbi:helix-turn-helix transcriptional regulator [Streptomyces lavendulae]|uniref:helix-turn-helix domain-containing protein n=1 Tax=Streptomyces lavendulae TaxID=1914 RepID=UPI0031EE5055